MERETSESQFLKKQLNNSRTLITNWKLSTANEILRKTGLQNILPFAAQSDSLQSDLCDRWYLVLQFDWSICELSPLVFTVPMQPPLTSRKLLRPDQIKQTYFIHTYTKQNKEQNRIKIFHLQAACMLNISMQSWTYDTHQGKTECIQHHFLSVKIVIKRQVFHNTIPNTMRVLSLWCAYKTNAQRRLFESLSTWCIVEEHNLTPR